MFYKTLSSTPMLLEERFMSLPHQVLKFIKMLIPEPEAQIKTEGQS